MAFKMNRPIIKGTKPHKASIAKAKKESDIAAYTPHAGDVLSAVNTYSRSFVPESIDYSLKNPKLDLKKKKKKTKEKEEKEEVVKGCTDSTATNYNSKATEDDGSCKYEKDEQPVTKEKKKKKEKKEKKGIKDFIANIKKNIKEKQNKNEEKFQAEQEEKRKIQAEKDAKYIGKGSVESLEENYEDSKEFRNRKKEEIIPIQPKEISQIPTDVSKPEIEKAIEIAQTSKTIDADKNPKYAIKKDAEGFGSLFNDDGYKYDVVTKADGSQEERWTYNGIPIRESEVASVEYEAIMNNVIRNEKSKSSGSSSTSTLTRETTPSNELLNKLKGGQKRRLDKLWANSKEGGTIRENMLKDGYIPPTE